MLFPSLSLGQFLTHPSGLRKNGTLLVEPSLCPNLNEIPLLLPRGTLRFSAIPIFKAIIF